MTIDQALDDLVAYSAALREHWPPPRPRKRRLTVTDKAALVKAWARIAAAIQTLTPAMPR